MSIRTSKTQCFVKIQFLLPACLGAALAYGAFSLFDDTAQQREHISALENRILDLELLLSQTEEELVDARFFSAGTFAADVQQPSNETKNRPVATGAKTPTGSATNASAMAETPSDSQHILRDLGTRSDRDPRSFSEKANALLATNTTKDSIAIVSKSVFDLADNRELLPDYELESLYQQHHHPELRRVLAQVLSARGDNRLLEQQIANSQTRLRSDNPAERQQALVELAKTRYASAATAIAPLLQDADTGVKLDALLALRATGNQSHVRAVAALVNDPDPAVSWLANDVINSLQNLSDRARTQLASADIIAELPVITAP